MFVEIAGENVENLLTLHLELKYDGALMTPLGAELGSGLDDAILEFNADSAGRLVIGLIDPRGVSRDGVLVQIEFEVTATSGSSPLVIESLEAFGGENLIDILVNARDGSFNAAGDAITAPIIAFGR